MLFIARTISVWVNDVFCYHYGRLCWCWCWWCLYVCPSVRFCFFFPMHCVHIKWTHISVLSVHHLALLPERWLLVCVCVCARFSLFITILLMAMLTSHQYSNRFLFWPFVFSLPPHEIWLFPMALCVHFFRYISFTLFIFPCVRYKLRTSSWN